MTHDLDRIWAALAVGLAYLAFVGVIAWRRRAGARATGAVLVVHASQTGTAEEIALATIAGLKAAGRPAVAVSLSNLTSGLLRQAEQALFVAATTGEGEPPDAAAPFVRAIMSQRLELGGLTYGLLALGDRHYADYCAFGRRLDGWLAESGARRLFPLIEVDNGEPAAIADWRHQVALLAGQQSLGGWTAPQFETWTLAAREVLNPRGAGASACLLRLLPKAGLPDWRAGDLVEIQLNHPVEGLIRREYSIASLPQDGGVELVVRRHQREDGATGAMSGWLTGAAALGSPVQMRLRINRGFHRQTEGPMILIGAGTGIAGLRAHVRGAAPGQRLWLIFGERTASADFLLGPEVVSWREQGRLTRLDLAFSRDQAEKVYVQHRIDQAAEQIKLWVEDGASIFVCGDRAHMAPAVDAALARAIGGHALLALSAAGRYRRDVY